MKYFLDSAKIDEIRYAYKNWNIDGITTNPKHVLASGKSFQTVLKELAEEFEGIEFPISAEIDPYLEKSEDMVVAAEEIAEISDNFCIKIPCTEQGLIAAKLLNEEGLKTNLTLVFSAAQALQAGRIGCRYVSPFVGWKEDRGEDTTEFIQEIVAIYENYNFETEIIVAAVRNAKQIVEVATYGVDIVTAAFDVYKTSFTHPFTDYGLKVFQDAWDQIKKD
ncbi:MAG TPA: transaldolase family protein [Candidatus Lokiarchaeia archaeon]|nr:transaldolase family protein [Candidatus Lokiarchaeia archaeon]